MVLAEDAHFHVVWATAMNVDDVKQWHDDVMAFLKRTQGSRAVCTVLPPNAPPAPGPVRVGVGQAIDAISGEGAYSGCIILGTGFAASVQRSVVAALGMLTTRHERAMKVADSVDNFIGRLPPELRAHGDAFRALVAEAEKHAAPKKSSAAPPP
jgi:hypothetical protein